MKCPQLTFSNILLCILLGIVSWADSAANKQGQGIFNITNEQDVSGNDLEFKRSGFFGAPPQVHSAYFSSQPESQPFLSNEVSCCLLDDPNGYSVPSSCCQPNIHFSSWQFPALYACIGYTLGKGVAYSSGYSSIGLLATSWRTSDRLIQPFIDIRGHILDNGEKAANVGLGARWFNSKLNVVLGANIYYDFCEGKYSDYNQIGVGAEILGANILGRCLDFRINGYIPLGRHHGSKKTIFDDYIGDYFVICTREERALSGFDAEIGSWLRRRNQCCCYDFDLYGAIGTYYFSTQCGPDVFGGLLRVEASCFNCINVELIATSDRVYDQRVQGRFEICIPLGGGWEFWKNSGNSYGNCRCQADGCWQRVQRREIIAAKESCKWYSNYESSSSCGCSAL